MADQLVLGLDTSTTVNVGLSRGQEVLATATVADRMAHVEQLMPLVRACLSEAEVRVGDLDQIVVGLGPGPFTGLRAGIVTAQILAWSAGKTLHGICSLDVIAAQIASRQGQARDASGGEFVVATDARRREVYWARYAADGSRLDGPHVDFPDQLPPLPVIGPALEVYPDLPDLGGPRFLDPGLLATAGPALPDAGREPIYLRRPDAAEPGRTKSVLLHHERGRRQRSEQ